MSGGLPELITAAAAKCPRLQEVTVFLPASNHDFTVRSLASLSQISMLDLSHWQAPEDGDVTTMQLFSGLLSLQVICQNQLHNCTIFAVNQMLEVVLGEI